MGIKESYVSYLKVKDSSEVTIKDYLVSLNKVSQYLLGKKFDECSIADFAELSIEAPITLIGLMKNDNLRANTIKARLNSLKSINGFLGDYGYITRDDQYTKDYLINKRMKELKDKSEDVKQKDVLTKEEINRLLVAVQMLGKHVLRRKLFILILVNTGIRIGAFIKIKLSDINWDDNTVTIREKGDKVRVKKLNSEIMETLKVYITRERVRYANEKSGEYVFITNRGTALTARHSDAEIKTICEKAGIKKKIHCHRLRATTATMVYEKTNDVEAVRRVLGHASISTSQIYIDRINESKNDEALDLFA